MICETSSSGGNNKSLQLVGAEDSQVTYCRVSHQFQPTSHSQCAMRHVPSPSAVTLEYEALHLYMEGAISLFGNVETFLNSDSQETESSTAITV